MPAKRSTTQTASQSTKVTRSKAPASKPGPAPSEVAKLRRDGATWQQVRDHFGVKTGSGAFTRALNAAGFDAAGLKLDGSGPRESKARVAKPKAA